MNGNFCAERLAHCDRRLDDLRKLMCTEFIAQEKAIKIASDAMNYRLEGMNEFREQLNAQAHTFVDRKTLEPQLDSVRDEIAELREWKSLTQGKASWSNFISALGFLVALAAVLLSVFK